MAGNSTNRFGGNALLAGGILFAVAVVLHPDVSSFEKARAVGAGIWAASHWAYLFGDVLLIAGLITLSRHLAAGASGGLSSVALAGGTIGFLLDTVTTGGHMFSFPPALAANAPNMQAMYDTVTAVNNGIGGAAVFSMYLGLFVLGLALRKEGWKAPVALAAIAVGAIQLALTFYGAFTGQVLFSSGAASYVIGVLSPLTYAFVGWAFSQKA